MENKIKNLIKTYEALADEAMTNANENLRNIPAYLEWWARYSAFMEAATSARKIIEDLT